MNVLFVGDFSSTYNILRTQVELIVKLKNKGVEPFVIGIFTDEIEKILIKAQINYKTLYPVSKIDFKYIYNIKKMMRTKNFDIIHFLNGGKSARSFLLAIKKNTTKTITFMGSVSLHWYDSTSYLTYLNPKIDKIICNNNYVYEHVRKQLFKKK